MLNNLYLYLSMLGMLPFFAFGAFILTKRLLEWYYVRQGKYKVIFRLSNYRTKTEFIKPKIDSFEYSGKTFNFSQQPGFVYFEGSTPVIEYDIKGKQINFVEEIKSEVDPENLDAVLFRTYNLGKRDSLKGQQIIFYLMVAAAVGSIVSAIILITLITGDLSIASLAPN